MCEGGISKPSPKRNPRTEWNLSIFRAIVLSLVALGGVEKAIMLGYVRKYLYIASGRFQVERKKSIYEFGIFFLLLFVNTFIGNHLFGQTAVNLTPAIGSGGKISENIRFVPFSDFQQILEKKPKSIILPRDVYEKMREAKEAYLARKPGSPLPELDLDFTFGSSFYKGIVGEKVGEFEATFLFELPNERWVMLPIPGGDIGIIDARLDGESVGIVVGPFTGIQDGEAPKGKVEFLQRSFNDARRTRGWSPSSNSRRQPQSNDFFLAVKGPGRHELKVKFVCPQVDDPEKNEMTFRIPRIPMNTFEIKLDKPGQFGEVDRSEGMVCRDDQGSGTFLTGVLGSTDRFTLRWSPRTTAVREEVPETASGTSGVEPVSQPKIVKAEEPPRMFADSLTLLSIGEGYIRSESVIRLNITRSPKGSVSFMLPKGTEVLDVRSDRLENYTVQATANGNRLLCNFNSRIKSVVDIAMVCDTKMSDTSERISLPVHQVEGAERDQGHIGVEARTSIEIRKLVQDGDADKNGENPLGASMVSSVDVSDLPVELVSRAVRPIILAYKYFTPPLKKPVVVDVIRHKDIPVLTSVIDKITATTVFGTDKTSVTCLDLRMKNNGKQYLEARLGSGSEILSASLNDAPVAPTTRGESQFLIPIGGAGMGRSTTTEFSVRVVYRSPIPLMESLTKIPYVLPKLDIDASQLEWILYAPERYAVISQKSNIDQTYRPIQYIPFAMVKDLFDFVAEPGFMVLSMIIIIIVLIIRKAAAISEGFFSLQRVLFWGGFAVVLLVLASVAGPMIGSITSPGMRYESRSMFEEKSKRESWRPSQSVQPQSRVENEEMSDAIESSKGKSFERKDSGYITGGLKKENKALGKISAPVVSRRFTAGRDRGALPVNMQIPTTGNSLVFYKNIIRAQEEVGFRGVFLWEPLRSLLSMALWALGVVVFLLILWLATMRRAVPAGILFIAYSLGLVLLEEKLPQAQSPGVAAFCLCLVVTLIYRVGRFFTAKSAAAGIIAIAVFFGAAPADARESTIDPRVEQTIDVFVPYSQLGERLPKDYPLVFLNYDEYKYLRDLGIPDPDPARWTPPVSVSYLSCVYEGQVAAGKVELAVRMEVELLGKGFKQIEFPTDGVGVRTLTIDGKPAVLASPLDLGKVVNLQNDFNQGSNTQNDMRQMQMNAPSQNFAQQVAQTTNGSFGHDTRAVILTDKEGRAVIEGKLVKDLFSKQQPQSRIEGFKMALARFGGGRLELNLDRAKQKVEVVPAARVQTREQPQGTLVSAILQPSAWLNVEWRDLVQASIKEEDVVVEPASATILPKDSKVFADHEQLFSISEGVIGIVDNVGLTIEQYPAGEFVFEVPGGVDIIEVSGTDLASWTCAPESNAQILRVSLNARRLNRIDLKIEMERQTPQINGEFLLDIPRLREILPKGFIERQKGYFGVEVRKGLEISVEKTDNATIVDPRELPASITGSAQGFMAAAYKYLQKISPTIRITKHQEVSVSTAQVDGALAHSLITRDGKILTQLDLTVRNNNNQFLVFDKLPGKMKILSVLVNGEPVKPGESDSKEIYVPLIRSPRVGKDFQAFGVTMVFSDDVREFESKGGFTLHLPGVSVDISRMGWRVDGPEGYFMMKGSGDFQIGWIDVPVVSQIDGGYGRDKVSMSNVMTQSVMRGENRERADAGAGFLPIVLTVPQTNNSLPMNKKLVTTKGPSPEVKVFYGKLSFLDPLYLLLSLVLGQILAMSIHGMFGGMRRGSLFGLFVIGIIGVGIYFIESLFGSYLTFSSQLHESFMMSVMCGLVMAVAWTILAGPKPVDKKEEKSQKTI